RAVPPGGPYILDFSRGERPMMNTTHAIGWKAKDFALQGIDGRTYSLADIRGPKGTLVVFICNHCPYVKASINRIVTEASALREIGIGTIAIMPNDTESYPEDSFDNMKAFAARHGFSFPYVIDTSQEVARAYGAQCTPCHAVDRAGAQAWSRPRLGLCDC